MAALAHVLSRRVSHVDAETAMFAGIVHEVGGFYLLSRAEEFPALLEDMSSRPDDIVDELENDNVENSNDDNKIDLKNED